MVRKQVFLIGFVLAFAPLAAHAERTTTWDFRKAESVMPLVENLTTVERVPEGLHIRTSQDGFAGWQNPAIPPTDVVIVYARNAHPLEAAFMWQPEGAQPGDLLQSFFPIDGGPDTTRAAVVPSRYKEWTESTPALAFGFPAGTDIVIEKIEWKSWGPGEKIVNAFRGFWTFDTVAAYSINFLWGPLLPLNPETRATLFDELPPLEMSAMRMAYLVIILAAIAAGVLFLLGKKRNAVLTVICTVAGAWILLDVRMGAELLSYATHDLGSYVLRPEGDRSFRTLGNLPDILDKTESALKDGDARTVVLLEPAGNARLSKARLRLYPIDVVPYSEDTKAGSGRAWLVINRPDATAGNGSVAVNGRTLSGPGKLIAEFGTGSFLFVER